MITLALIGAASDLEQAVTELRDFDQIDVQVLVKAQGSWIVSVPEAERTTVNRVASDYGLIVRKA
jgi:hypothetical protein